MCHSKSYHRGRRSHPAMHWKSQWEHPMKKHWKAKWKAHFQTPPVNVEETDEQYILYLFAPGLEKDDFQISTVDQILSISVEQKETEDNSYWRRKEFHPGKHFKREFELNDKVDKEAISASYKNGVLIVTLPKLEGMETLRQEIEIV